MRGSTLSQRVQAPDVCVANPSVLESQGGRLGLPTPGPDKLIVEDAYDQRYGIAHYRATACRTPATVPVSSWRSVGNSYNGFFIESFIDELAAQAGADPLQMRPKLINQEPSRQVLATVAEVVEITTTKDGVKVDQVFVAADVVTALDPPNIEAQMQSAVVFGLSAAMFGEISFAKGAVEQTNFHQYEAVRMLQAPKITVKVLESGAAIRGIGEPGTPPAAPALANAIFHAIGQRLRKLPLRKHIKFV